MGFVNKVVIVTGAGSGMGAATALLFAKKGADVVLVDRNENKLHNFAVNIKEFGIEPLAIVADVTRDEDAKRIIQETVNKFGKLDVLINGAGIINTGCILDGKILTSYDEIMKVNVRAVINLTTLAVPHLIQTKGNIVNISSIASKRVHNVLFSAYCISKAALDQFTKAAAKELAKSEVRVNSVNPGSVKTDLFANCGLTPLSLEVMNKNTALNRVSEPEEIAELILFLAGDKAKGITGSTFVSDNGTLLYCKRE